MAIGPVSQVPSSGIGPTGLSPVNKEALKNLNNKIKELLEDDKFTEARALIEQPANRSVLSQAGILNETIEWVNNKELLNKINKILELAKTNFKDGGRKEAQSVLEANLETINKANLKIEATLNTLEVDIILDEGLEIFERNGRNEAQQFFEARQVELKKAGKSVQKALDFTAARSTANEIINESLKRAQQGRIDEARQYLEANSEKLSNAQINLSRTLKLIREQNQRQDALSQIESFARMGLAERATTILRDNQESLSETGSDLTVVLTEFFPVRTGLREEKLRDEDVKFFDPDNQVLTWTIPAQGNNLKEIATSLRQTLDSNNSFYFRFDPETPGAENNRIALFEAVKRFYFEHKKEIDDLAAEASGDTKNRNFTFGSGTVSKISFREIGDPDVIWDDLLKGGYINGDGIIQEKFKGCRNSEELAVEHYFGQRDKIYEVLKNSQNGVVRFNKAFFEVLNKYRNTRPVNFQPVSGKEIATNKITASLQFARNNPFAALKIKLSLDRGLGIPATVTDDLSKNDLEFLADVLSGGAAYFHGHLSNPEIEELRKIQDKYNSLSQESRLISKLLLLSSSDLVTLTTPEEKSTLKVIAEKHNLIVRDTYFADSGVEPYFHRPINAEERQQLIKIRDDKFNQGSPSYKIINKLLRISFSGRIFLDDPAELKELDTLAEKEKGLISELRKSYYADSQANPKDAQKIRELIELIWGQKTLSTEESAAKAALTEGAPRNPTITAQKIGGYFENFPNLNYQDLKEYEKGLYVVIREAFAARINFDPKNPREYTSNVVWRLVKNTAIDAWTLLSEGARPAPVAMGINNIENWRLLVLKRMYLMETNKWKDFVEFQNNHKKEMETIVNQIDQIRRDSRRTEDQKIAELTKLIERFFYIRGLLENQYQQLFLVDQGFFDWFVKRFAILPSNQGFWGWFDQLRDTYLRQPFNEAELQSTVINPFTGKVIHLNDVHNILRGANSDSNVRNELALGWMSLDPAKGSQASALVKMALALSITYLRLDKESVGASFVPVDPNYEHLEMGINMMFNQEPPLSHIGAQIKSDLMLLSGQLYKEAPLIRTEFFNNFNQPDEIDVFTIKVLKRIIKDLSRQGANDPEIGRLKEVIKRLGGTVSKDALKKELKLKAEQDIPLEVLDLFEFEETRSDDLIPQISKSELDGILESLVKRQIINETQKEFFKKIILEALNAKKFEMTSDNFGDLNAQELMQAYYYLGKIFTGMTKQRDVSSQEGESPDSIIHRGLNLVTNGMWTEIWDHGVGRAWDAIPGSDRLGQAKKEFEARGIKEDSFGTTVGRYYGIRNPAALSVTGGTIDAVTQTVPDVAREFSYTLARFGPYVGAQFGAVLPYNIGRNLAYATGINQLFGGQEKTVLAIDEKVRPVEDSEGRLVFEKIGLDDVAKSVLTLAGQVFLFYNDPFLLYGWLKIPDDIHNGNWRLALVKFWCANFYLLAPGKDGFWSSTGGRFLSIDRFLWRMYAAAQKIKIWAKENGQLEELERETEGTPLGKALRCKTWKDYRNEYAAKRGWLGAMYEFGQDRDVAGSWLRRIMARTIVGAGKVGSGTEWLYSPLSKWHEFVTNRANEKSWAYGFKQVFDELLRIPQQTLNLTYWEGRGYRWATSSANAVGTGRFMQQENDLLNPARKQRVIEIDNSDFTEADTRVPGGPEPVLARPVPPDREMALPGAGRSSARSGPGEGEILGLSDEDLIRIFATERGQPRQVTFALKTGPRSVETMKLPVRRIVIDSIIATNSPDPVTIVPCKPGGIPFEAASDYASAEVHINSQRLNFQGANAIEIERQGGQQQKEISESEKNILLQLFGQELDFAVQKAELIPAENPAFFREAPLLTVSEFEKLINENDFSIVDINEIFRNGQVPLTREMTLDLVRLLNERSGSLMLTDRNSRKIVSKDKLLELIRQVTSETYTPQEADPRQSDHYVFELCGNDAKGNSRPAILNETDYSRLPEADGRRRVKLSDVAEVGKSRVVTRLRQIEGAPKPALEAQVIGRVETYLEGQLFARDVAEAQKEFADSWSDVRLQQESSRLLKLCDGSGSRQPTNAELIRAGAVYCEAVRRVTLKENTEALTEKYIKEGLPREQAVARARAEVRPVILTPSQIMAGYFGNLATAEVPVFIDLGTGEGKTWAIGLDQYLSLTRGFRVGIVTAQCDAYAKQNFNEIALVFEFLSVPTDFIEKTEKSPVRRRDAFRNGGSKRVIFCGFDMPRFSFLESIFPNFQGRPVFVPNTFYLKVSNDESDHGLWDMRRNPAIISSGGSAQAADQELVLLAEECVRGLYENGVLQERFIESSGSRENIGISVEGVKKVESVLQGKKLGGQRISGKIPETLLPYIRTALHVHKFMQRGTDYLERGGYIFTRRYVFRDKATGRKDFDLQFDLAMHKAVQAKIGCQKITDPGVSPVAVTVPEFFQYVVHSNYSGTEGPLAVARAREGGLAVAVESAFARTRIDHPGIVFKTKAEQLKAVVGQAITDAGRGASLVHAAVAEQAEQGVLSIDEIFDSIKTEFSSQGRENIPIYSLESLEQVAELIEEVEKQKEAASQDPSRDPRLLQNARDNLNSFLERLKKKENPKKREMALISREPGELPFIVMRLTDEISIAHQEKVARLIGSNRAITITDIANRALNPGLKTAIGQATGTTHVVIRSVVTQWKESVRHFLQEIARIGRPDPKRGFRAPGEDRGMYSLEDPNFAPAIRAYLDFEILQNGGNPVVILPPDYPDSIGLEVLRKTALEEIKYLEEKKAISPSEANKAREEVGRATKPEKIKKVMRGLGEQITAIVQRFWQVSEEQRIEENMRNDGSRGKADQKFNETLHKLNQLLENPAPTPGQIKEVFGQATKDAVKLLMKEMGISDAVNRQNWDIKKFCDEVAKRFGIELRIENPDNFQTAGELFEKISEGIDQQLTQASLTGYTKTRLIEILKERIAELQFTLEACRREVQFSPDRILQENALNEFLLGELSNVLAEGIRPEVTYNRVVQDPTTGLPITTGARIRVGALLRLRGFCTGRALGLGRVQLVAERVPDSVREKDAYIRFIEKQLEHKLRTLIEEGPAGFTEDANALTIEIITGTNTDGSPKKERFNLVSVDDIAKLNRALGKLGSRKRIYFDANQWRLVYGTARVEEVPQVSGVPAERRIIFESEEVISPSIRERSLAFIPRQPTTLFGDELRLETVIRGKAQEEFYEQMADLAFNEGSRDVPGAQLARAVFVTVGIRNKEEAESKKTEKQQVLDNFVEVVKAHESGHAAVFAKQGFEAVNASRILSPLADVLFETIADLNILRSIGSESTPAKIRLLAHLYYLNSFRADAKGRVSAAMTSVLEQCIGENGQVDFQKLADIEGRLSQFLENQLVEIEQQLAKIRDNQGRIDFLRQKERQIIKGIRNPSSLPAPASPGPVSKIASQPTPLPPPPPPPTRESAVDQIKTEKVRFRGVEVDKNNGTLILVYEKGRLVERLEIPQAQQTELDNLRTSLSGLIHELPVLFEYNPNHGGSKLLERIVRPNEAHLLRVDTRQKAEKAFEIIEQCQKQPATAAAGASQLAALGIIINPEAIIQVEAVVSPDYCAITSNFVGAHPNSIQAHFEPQSSVTSRTDQARRGLVLRLQPDDNLEICLVGSFSEARASAGGFRQPSVQEIVEATPEAFAGQLPLPSESAGRVVVIIPTKSETTEDLCAVLESIEKSAEGSQIYFESTEKISVNVSAGQAEIIKTYFNNYQSYTQQILNAPEEVGRILGLADLDAGFQQFLENRILTEIQLTLAGEPVKFSRQAGNIVLEFGRGQRQTFTIEEQALVSVFRFEKIADQIVEATLRAHPDYNPSLVRARVLASLQRLANKGAGQHQIPLTIISGRRENILFKEVGIEKSGKQFKVRVSNKVLAKLQTTDPSQDVYLQVVEELKREVQDEIRKARKQNSEYQNVSVNDFIKPLTYQTIAVQGKTITLSHRALASLTRCSSDTSQYREAMQELEAQLGQAGVADLAGARAEVLRGLFMVGYAERFQETFGQLTERLANNFYEEELRKIDLSKPDLNIGQEMQQARDKASKRMDQVAQTLSAETVLQELALRADSRWVGSEHIDDFLRKKYEEIAKKYNIGLPYRPPQSRNASGATDVRETLGTWKWLCIGAPKWLCIGAPGGGLGHKGAFVGKETARGAGEGLIATAIFVGAKNIWMHGLPWNWTGDAWLKAKEEIEAGTVGWAKFSARAGVGKAFFGLTGHQPTAFAFFLDTQRSIHDARPEEKFLAATTGVINFGSFVGGQQLTGRLIQVLPLPPWMKGTLATIGGMIGAEVSNLVVDSIVSRNPELGELFASPEFVTAGKVLDMAGSTYATKLYTQFGLKAASFVLRDLGAEAAAGTVGKLTPIVGWIIAGLDLVSWQVNDLVDFGTPDFRIREREDLYENWSKPFRYQKSKILYYNDWFWSQMPIFGRWASKIKVGNENEFFSAIKSTFFLSHGLLGLSMLGYIDRNSVIGPDGDKEVFRKIFDQARKNAEKNGIRIAESQRIPQKNFFRGVFNLIEEVKSNKITVEDFDTKLKDLIIQQAAENPDFDPRVAVIIAKTIKEKAEKEINQKFDQRDQQIGQPEQRLKFEIEQKFPDLFREYLSKIISKNYSDKLNEIRGAFLSNLPSRYSALPLQEQKALKEFYRAQGVEVENIKDPIEFLKKVLIFKIKTAPGGNQRLDAEINLLVEFQVNQILAGFTFDRITQGMKEPERQKLEAEFRQFLKENPFIRRGQTANLSQESPSFLHSANITTNATLTTYTVPQDLTALLPLPTGKDLFEKFSEFMLARQGISLILDEKEIESTYGNIRDFNQIPSPDVLRMSSPHRLPFLNETPNLVEGFKKYLESSGDIYETQEEAKKRGYLRFNNEMGQIISEYSREFSRGRLTALFLHCLEKGEDAFRKGEYDVALGYYSKIKDLEIASALKQKQINERYAFCLNKLKENPATKRSVAASLHIDTSPTEADIDKALIEICQRLAFLFEIKEQYENAKNSKEVDEISVEIDRITNPFFLNMPPVLQTKEVDVSSLPRRGQVLDTSPSSQSRADTQVTKIIEKKDGDTATLSLDPLSQQQSRRVRPGEFSSLRTDILRPIGLGNNRVPAFSPTLFRHDPIQPNSSIQLPSRFSISEDNGGTKTLPIDSFRQVEQRQKSQTSLIYRNYGNVISPPLNSLNQREPGQLNGQQPTIPQLPRFINEDNGGTKPLDLSQLPRIKP